MAVQLWDKVRDHGGQELHLLGYQPEAVSPNRVGVQGLGSRVRLCCPEWPFRLLGERKMDLTLVSEMGTSFFFCCSFIYFGFLGPTCRGQLPCEVNFVFCS